MDDALKLATLLLDVLKTLEFRSAAIGAALMLLVVYVFSLIHEKGTTGAGDFRRIYKDALRRSEANRRTSERRVEELLE